MAKKVSDQADYEQIISHLQIIRTWAEVDWECGYVSIINAKCCEDIVKWIDDALELLKEQEPVKPIDQGDDSYVCDNCGETVGWEELDAFGIDPVKYKFCPGCGRKVEWDDSDRNGNG